MYNEEYIESMLDQFSPLTLQRWNDSQRIYNRIATLIKISHYIYLPVPKQHQLLILHYSKQSFLWIILKRNVLGRKFHDPY